MKKLLSLLTLALSMASSTWALDQVDGVYQIGTAQDLADFATLVNGGTTGANAVLTADINMAGITSWTAIGDWNTNNVNSAFKGHFDGNGKRIYNVNFTSFTMASTYAKYQGLFGIISAGCVIENFIIEGAMTFGIANANTIQCAGSIAAYARDATSIIRNVHSLVDITNISTHITGRMGGILGCIPANNAKGKIENCSYSGTFDTGNYGGNYGGIIGYVQNGSTTYMDIVNCLFDGTLKKGSSNGGQLGGIIGYTRAGIVTIKNCLSVGTFEFPNSTDTNIGQFIGRLTYDSNTCGTTFDNNYYKNLGNPINGTSSGGSGNGTAPVGKTDAELASGEVCYFLNESVNGGTNWYQTLGTDNYPRPQGGGLIYAVNQHCNGVPKEDNTDYTNNTSDIVMDSHTFVNGLCSYCAAPDETYMTANGEGYYEISTPAQLKWFSAWVNSSSDNTSSNAVLTDDIDISSIAATWVPIGDWHTGNVNSAYKGHFNGQGHEISNFNVTTSQTYYGIFGVVSAATIENFSIRGTITNDGNYSNIGVIGYSRDTEVNIQNIQSHLTITNNANNKNVGGILGSGNAGTTNIDHCAFFGTINANDKTNAGGIVGYFANGSSSIVNITNCLFDGTITTSSDNGSNCGGIAGYGGANVSGVKIKNCLSLGTITSAGTKKGQFFGNILNAGSSITNCYYQGDNIYGTGSSALTSVEATPVTDTQLSSGEICYLLNGDQSAIAWYQTKGTDAKPTLDSTHGQIYVNGTVCPDTGAPQGTVSYSNTPGTTIGSHVPVDGFCTYCGTLDATYMIANSEGFYEIGNKEQLVWFAAKVNAGTYDAKAKLTADIDMTDADISHFPIGMGTDTGGMRYIGTFDGQGHKISKFYLTGLSNSANEGNGMFNTYTGVVLKNFWLDSSCKIEGTQLVGLVGRHYGGGTFENVGNCADVTGVQNNVGGLIGGVLGNSSDKKNVTIRNCWTTGRITTTNPSASNGKDCGALTGWFNNAKVAIEGFWTVADVVNPKQEDMYVYRNGGGASFSIINSYSKNGTQPNYTNFTDEQLANGWLCYGLNGDQSNIAWYQTIGTDNYPVLDNSSKQVFELTVSSAGYASFVPTVNITAMPTGVTAYVGQKTANALHLEEITALPADNAFVVKAAEGAYYYNGTDETVTLGETENDLTFSTADITSDGSQYCLARKGDPAVVGFYQVNSGVNIPARKVYLVVSGSGVKSFYGFEEDDATGIDNLNSDVSANKTIYNVAGQRINKMQKGINIINGKKVLF